MMRAAPFLLCAALLAQTKPAVQPKDYGRFETLGQTTISPDGKWLAWGVSKSSGERELRLTAIASGETKTFAYGSQVSFSADSRFAAWAVGLSEEQEEKLRKDKKPIRRKLGLIDLSTGAQSTVDEIESFAFNASGSSLAMKRYAPEKNPPPPPDAPAPEAPPGSTLIVRHLATGRDATFGNVSEFAWQDLPKTGRLLAMAINTEDKTGSGVHLFDPDTGNLRVLDSASSAYTGLAWRKKSADLAVLKGKSDEGREGPTQIAMAWSNLGEQSEAARTFDPAKDGAVPAGMRTVSYRKPTWSHDGRIVFLGLAKWDPKIVPPKDAKDKPKEEEQAAVDVWHWRDADVLPRQKIGAKRDRERSLLAAWHLDSGKLVQLGRSFQEQVRPLKGQPVALVTEWDAYAMERSIGRPAANVFLADLATGERAEIRRKLDDDHYLGASSSGRYLIFLEGNHYWTVNVATRAVTNITKSVCTSFVDRDSDFTQKQKPPFGIAGWTRDDAAVLLYDEFDIWEVASDGSKATRLTEGAAGKLRHRVTQLDPDAEFIDRDRPVFLTLFGTRSKQSGFARLEGARTERLKLEDRRFQRLAKAKEADVFIHSSESFAESPSVLVSGTDFQAKPAARTNPFLGDWAWGRSEIVDYKNSAGVPLQGALHYPAGYEPGKKYPMVVLVYEKLSDSVHRFAAPSEREYYNTTAFTQNGYLLLTPDIVFRPRQPGLSVADCVGAAVRKVIDMGAADPKRVGVIGHSWGGFDSTFLATHTNLFAAAVAGAPITNLVSNYGNHHWNEGIAETDHIETGQQRMEVPLWEDLDSYIRNSAVFGAHSMATPLLIEFGDADGVVFYHQGVELYNIARRAGKPVVLLVYNGENHGLSKKPNQIDYHRRIRSWFGHYLKGEPAESWITEGLPYLQRQDDLKRLKANNPPPR